MTEQKPNSETMLPEQEQKILDTALLESDQLLARSLHDDEARRRRKRLAWLSVLVIGGVVMSALLFVFLFAEPISDGLAVVEKSQPTRQEVERAEALAAEGWQLWKNQNLVAAARKFEESVDLNPEDANAWNGYGWALFNSGQSTKALRAFEKCVELSPNHPAGLNGLGQLYLSRGEYDQAEKYLKKSAKNPHASAAWYGLTRVYLLTGKYKRALPWAKKSVKSNPKDKIAQQMLAAAKAGELDDELRRMLEPVAVREEQEHGEALNPEPSDDDESKKAQVDQGADDKQWQERLLSTKQSDPWHVGAEIGMELVRIPGDRPYEILAKHWKKIPSSVRKQILKGFTPGMMGNKKMHPRFFDVMHLGMTDPDEGVRSYAAAYIEMQGLPNFEHDDQAYAAWREQNKDRPAKQIVED